MKGRTSAGFGWATKDEMEITTSSNVTVGRMIKKPSCGGQSPVGAQFATNYIYPYGKIALLSGWRQCPGGRLQDEDGRDYSPGSSCHQTSL